jgi:hypothetical protein
MRVLGIAAICAATIAWSGQGYAAPQLDTIHTFNQTDGDGPNSALIQDAAGALYGTTAWGGAARPGCPTSASKSPPGCGVVFRLAPPAAAKKPWTVTVLHDFSAGSDGIQPSGNLLADKAGNLYGVTLAGGAGTNYCPGSTNAPADIGCGIVYKLTRPASEKAPWAETVLFRFTGANGAFPLGTLVFDSKGNLYGTTAAGGATAKCAATVESPAGCGVVFKLTKPAADKTAWTETVLHSFAGGADGAYATAGLVFDKSGNLYGTTRDGGGTLAACPATTDGLRGGCGIAFKLAPSAGGAWTETIIRRFAGKNQAANPVASLVFDTAGNLYGTSNAGGGQVSSVFRSGGGTVFELSPPATGTIWTERVLHAFGGANDAVGLIAGVVMDPTGNLYGTAYSGSSFGGAVYKLARPAGGTGGWKETLLAKFSTTGAIAPVGGLIRNKVGNFFGTTEAGTLPPYGDGSVFKLTP